MRKDSFIALVGSHNYNLNTESSDYDFKSFFYPSFDDLYSGEKYSKARTSDNEDTEFHDVRKLPDMLWKSNVNFVEVLFSKGASVLDSGLYRELHNRREDIARMNLPYLYDACMGMFYKKKKEYERDLNNCSEWSKVCKHIMSASRIVDFLHRYEMNGWDFEAAFSYEDDEYMRGTLMSIRNGKYESKTELDVFIDGAENLLNAIKSRYKEQKEDIETKEWLYNVVKSYVMQHLREELSSI